MWARRCGAPPAWPSRVKVLIMSFITGAVGFAVFQYMSDADAGYLNLSMPKNDAVLCLIEWPLRHSLADWGRQDPWEDWAAYRTNITSFVETRRCAALNVTDQMCTNVRVPLNGMARSLGIPLGIQGKEYQWGNDAVEMYGYVFLWLTACMGIMVMVHDLALLSPTWKDYIADWQTIRNQFRCWHLLWAVLGFKCWRRMMRRRGIKCGERRLMKRVSYVLGIGLTPVFIAWAVLAFFLLVIPVATFYFLRYPIRLSRIVLFLNCMASGVLGVVLTLHSLTFLIDVEKRQSYAVTWIVPNAKGYPCVCGCTFPLGAGRCTTLLLVGIVVAYKAFTLAFRCLKGLRRSNWASLMSVLFPVPLTVYEVMWTTPSGDPIQYRKEGDPVQGELAFDPFALMDEQPESGATTLTLVPTPIDPENEPATWTVEDVAAYLVELGLGEYCEAAQKNQVDGAMLLDLLRVPGDKGLAELGITSLLHVSKIRSQLTFHKGALLGPGASAGHGLRPCASGVAPRRMVGPVPSPVPPLPKKKAHLEYIGCCGFPCRRGENSGKRYDEDDEKSESEDAAAGEPPVRPPAVNADDSQVSTRSL
mmetsp:Transcript_71771/g.201424  ORF Transcript_71771/g.201424 Transcript_71771/m.201424 type:complete len:588 (-) Transcript_71771:73-1836(-)|eukprot:CAMPEP_0176260504 /NCGR_PEP_ID=MMETSP0121_2-20121125/39617_1 /TAXON_ID=160619 /ORGANISM="Kryptoperidinium foliaceum, Strain CCMP 1326" /LENGTH=587 /DNA_ID=CAMNT_0017600417 /DNA_START=18 /DNA_END=1781 /DNA_ORIENTATION=+